MVATSPPTAMGRLVEKAPGLVLVLVPKVRVPLPSVRLLKTVPLSAWTLVFTLAGSMAPPFAVAAPSAASLAMIRRPARIEVPPV